MKLTIPGIKDAEVGFKPKPPGEYAITPEQYEVRDTRDGSSQYIHWVLHITEGDHMGGKLFYNTPLRAEGLGITKAFFNAFGVEIESDEIDPDVVKGIAAVAVVEHEEYDGKVRERVVGVNPA